MKKGATINITNIFNKQNTVHCIVFIYCAMHMPRKTRKRHGRPHCVCVWYVIKSYIRWIGWYCNFSDTTQNRLNLFPPLLQIDLIWKLHCYWLHVWHGINRLFTLLQPPLTNTSTILCYKTLEWKWAISERCDVTSVDIREKFSGIGGKNWVWWNFITLFVCMKR